MNADDKIGLSVLLTLSSALFALGFLLLRRETSPCKWPQVKGVITKSSIEGSQKEKYPVIEYEFIYQGQSHKSSHWRFGNYSTGYKSSAEAITSRYPVGMPVTVFVNVRKPANSVLDARASSLCWIPFAAGLFLLVIVILALLNSDR